MKKVLYLTNIEVPYRVCFFNELAKHCDLTVLYERKKSSNRNNEWSKSEKHIFKSKYLNGIKIKAENAFSFGILKEIFSDYDVVIVGCYNSPVQMLAILTMKILRKPYILSVDGENFINDNSLKTKMKRFFIKGAEKYLVAGEKSADSLKKAVGDREVIPYYFSSLYKDEIENNSKTSFGVKRNDTVLVVGQYFDYKGMDVALKAARLDSSIRYKFVGMGNRTQLFIEEQEIMPSDNIEFIPFLQKHQLEEEYKSCSMVVLPSRQECWGLVINEAASFGTPIVSTWGSGAAVEFISGQFMDCLAEPDNPQALYNAIKSLINSKNKDDYSRFLIEKSKKYCIENSVKAHMSVIEDFK